MKILIIICTYNPLDRSVFSVWEKCISSFVDQREEGDTIDIVLADNVSGEVTKKWFCIAKEKYGIDVVHVPWYFTTQFIPYNFALAGRTEYDYYIYCASDVSLMNKGDLKRLIEDMPVDCDIIHPQATSDMNQRFCYKDKDPSLIDIGNGVNGHLFVFKHHFFEAYDFRYVDIFGSNATELILPYQCKAIGTKMYISHRILVEHHGAGSLDKKVQPKNIPFINPYYSRDFFSAIKLGRSVGFGFMETSRSFKIALNLYLNNGFKYRVGDSCDYWHTLKDIVKTGLDILLNRNVHEFYIEHDIQLMNEVSLYKFIKENLYLNSSEFNYCRLRCHA